MKTTLNAKELRELGACEEGYDAFVAAHGEKTVTLTQAYESNGCDDFWWYLDSVYKDLSDTQKSELRMLAADYAERVLSIFEEKYPDDNRPRLAIEAARNFSNNLIGEAELACARIAAATSEATAATGATGARVAARAAARAANAAASNAAAATALAAANTSDADARFEERKWQEKKLLELLKKWESEE